MDGNDALGLGAVPMRFYANWDTDRASNYSIPRALSMVLSRLTFFKPLETENTLAISVRLQGHKRSLRSNDIVTLNTNAGARINLDISFVIQYAHFFKRKSNILEILVQRRKKYKNRQIPGFKTLAAGFLDLEDVLQVGGHREVRIFSARHWSKPDVDADSCHVATIFISHCQTVAVDTGAKGPKQTAVKDSTIREESEEDVLEDESSDDSEEDVHELADFAQTPRIHSSRRKRQRSIKKSNQNNIKQRLVKLLRRFKASEENAEEGDTASVLKPTAEELEEIFEELENISDSGPEVEMDKLSIRSNPRPGLHRPFFGSKSDILPVIDDAVGSDDSDSEAQTSSEGELAEQQAARGGRAEPLASQSAHGFAKCDQRLVKSSTTSGSLNLLSLHELKAMDTPPTINDMLSRLDSDSSIVASNVWICSSADFPWISRVDFSPLKRARILDCPTASDVRAVVQNVVSRIQKFCNTNSVAPSPTLIGVYGTDRHVSHILRAYVDFLQNKPTQDWITHLRFTVLCPPASALGRLLSQAADTGHSEASWRALTRTAAHFESGEATPLHLHELEEVLHNTMAAAANQAEKRLLNLPIGEVMLQLSRFSDFSTSAASSSASQESHLFTPFLSEIHLGNLDALNYLYFMKNSMEDPNVSGTSAGTGPAASASALSHPHNHSVSAASPPNSPQLPKPSEPSRELHLEYWTYLPNVSPPSNHVPDLYGLEGGLGTAGPNANKTGVVGNKYSIKASLRTLSIARESMSTLLSIQFVKEKKKDKVLQKLGRKPKPRASDGFIHSQARVVANVSRLICSGAKNTELELSVDGVVWKHIRFFQVASQWQTHVKLFPISMPSPPQSAR